MHCWPPRPTAAAVAAAARSAEIDAQILDDARARREQIPVLVLGEPDSGLPTLVQQMKILAGGGYSPADRRAWRDVLRRNAWVCIGALAGLVGRIMAETPDVFGEGSDEMAWARALVGAFPNASGSRSEDEKEDKLHLGAPIAQDENGAKVWTRAVQYAALGLINHPAVAAALHAEPKELSMPSSTRELLPALNRIVDPDYLPYDADILLADGRSSAIVETVVHIDSSRRIIMVDVSGLCSSPRKWLHHFDNVDSQSVKSVIFCASLVGYDAPLHDAGGGRTRLHQSLMMFSEHVNSLWLRRSNIILFLNNLHEFERKLAKSPVKQYFPDYAGGPGAAEAASFIQSLFEKENHAGLPLTSHMTEAADPDNLRSTFALVQRSVCTATMHVITEVG